MTDIWIKHFSKFIKSNKTFCRDINAHLPFCDECPICKKCNLYVGLSTTNFRTRKVKHMQEMLAKELPEKIVEALL